VMGDACIHVLGDISLQKLVDQEFLHTVDGAF